jgi:tetratricopeptide (TPR) repeat protein
MAKLEPPDAFAISAALGWIELGNPTEALAELEQVTKANQNHPGVLEVRWAALAELKRWEPALAAASELVRVNPDNASGWLHRAYALRRIPNGGLVQAWEILLPAADKFPKEPIIPYNLACYACQLQQLDEARTWLKRAMKIGKPLEIKRMALTDEDLKPLWPEIRSRSFR